MAHHRRKERLRGRIKDRYLQDGRVLACEANESSSQTQQLVSFFSPVHGRSSGLIQRKDGLEMTLYSWPAGTLASTVVHYRSSQILALTGWRSVPGEREDRMSTG